MNSTKYITYQKYIYIDYLAVFFMLMASGTVEFFTMNAKVTVIGFMLFSIYYFIHKKDIQVDSSNIVITLLILSYFFVNRYFINNDVSADSTWFYTYSLFAIGSFFIVSKIRYSTFKIILLNLVSLIAIKSLIVFALSGMNMITPDMQVHDFAIYRMYLWENLGWGDSFHRMASLFWEPGACQVILNGTLLLYLDDIVHKKLSKKDNVKVIIVLIGSIFTYSTASYFVLLLFIGYYIFNEITKRKNIKSFIVLIFLLPLFAYTTYLIFNSDVIQNKLSQKGTEGTSYEIRRNDNLGMLYMISQRPFFGYGIGTESYNQIALQTDNRTSSNGILSYGASFGLVFLIPLLIRIYYDTKQFNKLTASRILLFIIIVFMNSFEVFMYFPFTYIFILKFGVPKVRYIINNKFKKDDSNFEPIIRR